MSLKYKILISFSILAVFFGFYGFKDGETRLTSKGPASTVKKERQTAAVEKPDENEEMVAAILIMPKSYLPALKRFSQSAMARDIKILKAELEIKDGKMTAVRQAKRVKQPDRNIKPFDNPTPQTFVTRSAHPSDQQKQTVSSGILYLLAGLRNHRFIR
jgi:hypothetical protein